MAKGKLSEDTIRFIVEADSSKLQQEIHKTNKSIKSLEDERKTLLEQEAAMKRARLTESKEYKELTNKIKQKTQSIANEKLKLQELYKALGTNCMTMAQLRKEARNLQRQLDNTSKALEPQAYQEYANKLKEIKSRMEELKGTASDLKDIFGIMKQGGIKGIISKLFSMDGVKGLLAGNILLNVGGMAATIIIEGAKKVFEKAKLFYEFNVEIEEARRLTREFLDVEGKELTEISSEISAIAKQTGHEYKDVLSSVDMLMNQFGLTAKEAYDAIKDGIQAGADENGSFLSQIQQYAPAFHDAGVSVNDLVALITQTRSGIFNEQGMSLIQTATNRIRIMSTATQKALDDIGISSHQLEQDLVSGDKSIIQAVQMIASKIQELPPNSQQVGEVMKDVFGKTASNEGMKMIETIANISTNMDDLKDVTGEYGKLQREHIDTQAELNQKMSDMFGIGQGGFKEMTTKAEIFILRGLIKTIDYCESLYDELAAVRLVVEFVKTTFDTCFKAIEFGFDLIIDVVKGVGRELKALANMVEGIFTFDFEQIKNGWNQMGSGFSKTAKEIANDGMDVGKRWGDNFVKGIYNVIGKNKVNSPEVEGGSIGEVNVIGKRKNTPGTINAGGKSGGSVNKDNADDLVLKENAEARKNEIEKAKRDYQEDINAFNIALAQKRITQEQYNVLTLSLKKTHAERLLEIENSYYERSQSINLKDSTKRAELLKQQEQNVYQAKQQHFEAQLEIEKQYQDMLGKIVSEGEFKQQLTLEEEKNAKLAVLEGYYNASLEFAQKYGQDVNAVEQAYSQARLNIEKEYAEKAAQAQQQVRQKYGLLSDSERLTQELNSIREDYDKKLLTREQYEQAVTAKEKEFADKRTQQRVQLGVERQNDYQQQLEQLRTALDQQLITEQEYDERIKNLKMESWKQQFDYYSQLFGSAFSALQDAEIANVDAKYDAEIEAARQAGEDTTDIENKKANEKLKIQKKYADVNFAIKASQIIADTAVSIMKAISELGPIAGPIAAAVMGVTGAAQLAAANVEREKVKRMTLSGATSSNQVSGSRVATGLEDGGSIDEKSEGIPVPKNKESQKRRKETDKDAPMATGLASGGSMDIERKQDGKMFHAKYDPLKRGYIDHPTVIVGEGPTGKSREWVASNAAVTNPTVAPLIDIIDRAQRVGTISTLDMRKYLLQQQVRGLQQGGYMTGHAQGSQPGAKGVNGGTVVVRTNQMEAVNPETMERLLSVLERLETRGIKSFVALDELDAQQKLRSQSRKIGSKT